MTPDQIEQLARKAGGRPFADEGNPGKPLFKFRQKQLAKFVRLVLEESTHTIQATQEGKHADI